LGEGTVSIPNPEGFSWLDGLWLVDLLIVRLWLVVGLMRLLVVRFGTVIHRKLVGFRLVMWQRNIGCRSRVLFLGARLGLGNGGGNVGRSWVPWLMVVNWSGLVWGSVLPRHRLPPGHGAGALIVLLWLGGLGIGGSFVVSRVLSYERQAINL